LLAVIYKETVGWLPNSVVNVLTKMLFFLHLHMSS